MSARRGARRLAALTTLAVVGACTEPARSPERAAPSSVTILFLVDTLRADRLATYGHAKDTSPTLDALSARGVVFESAWSPAPWTLPSTASLLTGVDVLGHGAGLSGPTRNLGEQVPSGLADGVPTIAERFADAGWRCEALVTNPFVGFGLERGFEHFELRQTEGSEVVRWGLERLAVEDERPLFLLLHLMDVHDPLLVPEEDVLAIDDDASQVPLWARTFEMLAETETYRDARLRVYDGAVRYVDRQLGLLLDGVESLGLTDRTTLAFTSDHGEEVFESAALQRASAYRALEGRSAIGHGHTLFEELLHVPLVIAGAGVEAPGRFEGLVASHDLAPTLLELAGVPFAASEMDARSLAPLLRGSTDFERSVLTTGIAYGPDRSGLVRDGWQLVRGAEGERTVLVEMGDPTRRDRAAERPELVEQYLADLEAAELGAAVRSGTSIELDDAQRARLRAIGYLGDEE